jgi:hypothetical protein
MDPQQYELPRIGEKLSTSQPRETGTGTGTEELGCAFVDAILVAASTHIATFIEGEAYHKTMEDIDTTFITENTSRIQNLVRDYWIASNYPIQPNAGEIGYTVRRFLRAAADVNTHRSLTVPSASARRTSPSASPIVEPIVGISHRTNR